MISLTETKANRTDKFGETELLRLTKKNLPEEENQAAGKKAKAKPQQTRRRTTW